MNKNLEEWGETKVLTISPGVSEDPVLRQAMKMVCDWSNLMGLRGFQVRDLTFSDENREKPTDPMPRNVEVTCKIRLKPD